MAKTEHYWCSLRIYGNKGNEITLCTWTLRWRWAIHLKDFDTSCVGESFATCCCNFIRLLSSCKFKWISKNTTAPKSFRDLWLLKKGPKRDLIFDGLGTQEGPWTPKMGNPKSREIATQPNSQKSFFLQNCLQRSFKGWGPRYTEQKIITCRVVLTFTSKPFHFHSSTRHNYFISSFQTLLSQHSS